MPWGSFGCVRSIQPRAGGLTVRSCAFGQFPCALKLVGFVQVRLVNSRTPTGSFARVQSIAARPGGRRVRVRSISVRSGCRRVR